MPVKSKVFVRMITRAEESPRSVVYQPTVPNPEVMHNRALDKKRLRNSGRRGLIHTTNKLGISRRVDGRGAATASDAVCEAFSGPGHPNG